MGNSPVVETAEVLLGARLLDPAESGVEETFLGLLRVDCGTVKGYIKVLPGRQLCNELIGATLGAALGLLVPRVFLARATPTVLPFSQLPVATSALRAMAR